MRRSWSRGRLTIVSVSFFYFFFLFFWGDQHLIVITPGRVLTKLDSMIAVTSIERRRPGEFSMTGRVRVDHGNEITASTR